MTNTKKTGVRALAWVLVFALIALSIPVMAITASAKDTVVASWSIDGSTALEGTTVSIKCGKVGTDKTTFGKFVSDNFSKMIDGKHYVEFVITGTALNNTKPTLVSNLFSKAISVKDGTLSPVTTATTITYSSKGLTLTQSKGITGATDTNAKIDIQNLDGATVSSFTFTIYEKGGGEEPVETKHKITINAIEHGTVTANPTEATATTEVTLTAKADNGYKLESLTVTAGGTSVAVSNNKFLMPDSDVTVSATFVAESHEDPTPTGNDKVIASWDGVAGYSYLYQGKLDIETYGYTAQAGSKWEDFCPSIANVTKDQYVVITASAPITGASAGGYGRFTSRTWNETSSATEATSLDDNGATFILNGPLTSKLDNSNLAFVFGNSVTNKPSPSEFNISVKVYEKGSSEPQATKIAVPTEITGLIYNGEEQTGVAEGEGYTLTGNTATAADMYTATATLKDGYIWDDDSTDPKDIDWSIAKATPTAGLFKFSAPESSVYDGNEKYADVKFDSQIFSGVGSITVYYCEDGGTRTKDAPKNAGTYAVSISVDEGPNFTAADSLTNDDWKFTINKAKVEIPTAKTGLIYNGKEQTGVEGGDLYTVQGGTATNADEYTATAVLNDTTNYVWVGGTTENQDIDWSIAKATDNEITGVPAIKDWVAGETASIVDLTGVSATYDEPVAVYYTDKTCEKPIDFDYITEVGTYYVRAEVAGTDNYNGAVSDPVAFKVTDPAVANAKYSAALTLNNDIDINLQVDGFGDGFDPQNLTVTVDGKALPAQELVYDTKTGILTCKAAEVHPNEMAVEHEIEVSYNGVVAKEFTYSVVKYCKAVFAQLGEESDLGKLCKAVLNYGAWVDNYVKRALSDEYNNPDYTSDINAGYEITAFPGIDSQKVVADKLGTVGCIIDGGCSLELGSTITMNFFVTTAEEMPDPEKDILILNNEGNRVDPENITVSEDSGAYTYVISVKNISASKLSRSYKLMFMSDMAKAYKDGDTIQTVAKNTTSYLQYSVYTYCNDVLNPPTDTTYTETLQTLCQAIYNYGEVAAAYKK